MQYLSVSRGQGSPSDRRQLSESVDNDRTPRSSLHAKFSVPGSKKGSSIKKKASPQTKN